MNSPKLIVLFIFSNFFAGFLPGLNSLTRAAEGSSCLKKEVSARLDLSIPRPPALKKSNSVPLKNKVTQIDHLRENVTLLDLGGSKNTSALSGLGDGTYTYVIDSENHLAFMNRTINPGRNIKITEDTPILGSHEGLALFLKDHFKAEPVLLASGEIHVRNGRVLSVSNGSGTYRGDIGNLLYALQELSRAGLKIDGRTFRRDYATGKFVDPHGIVGDPFGSVAMQARLDLKFQNDPHLRQILERTRRVFMEFDRRHPSDAEVRRFFLNREESPENRNLLFTGAMFYSQWSSPHDTEGYLLDSLLGHVGEEDFNRLLGLMEKASN